MISQEILRREGPLKARRRSVGTGRALEGAGFALLAPGVAADAGFRLPGFRVVFMLEFTSTTSSGGDGGGGQGCKPRVSPGAPPLRLTTEFTSRAWPPSQKLTHAELNSCQVTLNDCISADLVPTRRGRLGPVAVFRPLQVCHPWRRTAQVGSPDSASAALRPRAPSCSPAPVEQTANLLITCLQMRCWPA